MWSINNAGVFGDSFGVVTCLFTAFAFIGVLINIDMQREDMAMQQENIDIQNFESNFFQMLNQLNEITKDIQFHPRSATIVSGRTALHSILRELQAEYRFSAMPLNKYPLSIDNLSNAYDLFWKKNGVTLGHYFRWLYHLINYVDTSLVHNKSFYVKLACAQLSTQELVLLYYNAAFKRGEKFKRFIQMYSIMSNIEVMHLAHESHSELIENTEFWKDL